MQPWSVNPLSCAIQIVWVWDNCWDILRARIEGDGKDFFCKKNDKKHTLYKTTIPLLILCIM